MNRFTIVDTARGRTGCAIHNDREIVRVAPDPFRSAEGVVRMMAAALLADNVHPKEAFALRIDEREPVTISLEDMAAGKDLYDEPRPLPVSAIGRTV